MKTITFYCTCVILLILSISKSNAQLQASNWYFGQNAGLSFNTNPPSALLNGVLSTYEGCATISDNNGNLLFYTDGMFVYNRNHQQMPNGFGLLGDPSSAQSGIIVPKPGNINQYYIFTVFAEGGPYGFRYSEVDLSLNSGLGDVIASTKNTLLFAPSVEKVAAVKHSNGFYTWVIAHGINNNRFYAYLIDCQGINPAITSDVGVVEGTPGWGGMAVSSDGQKLAKAARVAGFELFDFNNTTGAVTNPIHLGYFTGCYGISFSPNNSLLYGCVIEGGALFQWNLNAGSPAAIINSRVQIGTGQGNPGQYGGGAIQQGINGKLYIPHCNQSYLSAINNPDIIGAGCNLQHFAVNLQGRNAQLGLPPFIQSILINTSSITYTQQCQTFTFGFTNNTNVDSIRWNFGDVNSGSGNTSTIPNPSHVFSANGQYRISLVRYLNCIRDTTFLDINVTNDIISTRDTSICRGASIQLQAGGTGTLSWSTGASTPSITVNPLQTTTYYCTLTNGTGSCTDSIKVTVNVGDFTSITQATCDSLRWNNNLYTTGGVYYYDYTNSAGCPSADTIRLTVNYSTNTRFDVDTCANYLWGGINYTQSGIYLNSYTNNSGCPSTDTLDLSILSKPDLGQDRTENICSGDSRDITSYFNTIGSTNTWTLDNSPIGPPISVSVAGTYQLISFNNNGCSDTVKINLIVQPPVIADAGPDRFEAVNQPFQLNGTGGNICSWTPTGLLNNSQICNPTATISGNTWFLLTVENNFGCSDTDSVLIKAINGPGFYLPNAFTPNGDGLNEVFNLIAVGISELEYFRIFNRYGELIFQSNVVGNGWDGTYKGVKQTMGNYVYMVKGKDRNSKPITLKGNVLLIR